jgi:hypothetical protein
MPEEPTAPENLDPQVQPPEPPPEEPAPEATNGSAPCPGPHTVAEEDQAQTDAAPDAEEEAKPQQEQPEQ